MKVIRKVALAYIKDRKVIMVRTKKNADVYYTLGGKIEEGENDVDCLVREVKEEVGVDVDKNSLQFLHEFENEAHGHENTMLNIRLYIGDLLAEPFPSSEVVEIKYFDSTAKPEVLTVMGAEIVKWLKRHKFID